MVAIGETITIVNKSGKVVSTSKHLVNVFNEAKSAYNERKAELKAFRKSRADKDRLDETQARLETLTFHETSISPARSGSAGRRSERPQERPPMHRGVSDSFYINDSFEHRRSSRRPSPLAQEVQSDLRAGELARRHTDDLTLEHRSVRGLSKHRSSSLDDIDMDLAYGELPPPLPERRYDEEIELRAKMSGLQRLLDECNCLQYSVTAIIDNLQQNPDALAAVALTLAEISNLAGKLAPGALGALKGSFPAIVALLASPEFAIAAGAAVGVTIVVLGGYKIIKKLQARKEEDVFPVRSSDSRQSGITESDLESLHEIDRVEVWRRGIADVEAESLGSTVDGELVTPHAARTMIADGRLTAADLKSRTDSDVHSKRRRRHRSSSKSEQDSKATRSTRPRSETRAKSKKENGGLRMLFKRKATTVTPEKR